MAIFYYKFLSFSNIAALLAIVTFILQAIIIDEATYNVDEYVCFIFIAADCYHCIRLVLHIPLSEADSAGPTFWLGYSWLIAGKWFILYLCGEELKSPLSDVERNTFYFAYYSYPLIYLFLMFRATKPLFVSMSNTITPDVMMHYETFWTVFVDLCDIAYQSSHFVFEHSKTNPPSHWISVLKHPGSWKLFREATALILFLGIVCHGQSFPCAEWQLPAVEREQFKRAQFKSKSQKNTGDENYEKTEDMKEREYRDFISQLDVTYSRERSALVSAFIVNLPLFFCRLYLHYLTLLLDLKATLELLLLLKNFCYVFFQYLQLRVVLRRRNELFSYLQQGSAPYPARVTWNSGVLFDTALLVVIGFSIGTCLSWQTEIGSAFEWNWFGDHGVFQGFNFNIASLGLLTSR